MREDFVGWGSRMGSGGSPAMRARLCIYFSGQREQNFHQILRRSSTSKDRETLLWG